MIGAGGGKRTRRPTKHAAASAYGGGAEIKRGHVRRIAVVPCYSRRQIKPPHNFPIQYNQKKLTEQKNDSQAKCQYLPMPFLLNLYNHSNRTRRK
jgi:hypothetical protein